MSLIPTRLDLARIPSAQTQLDIATLMQARGVIAEHRPPHRSVWLLTRPAADIVADTDRRIAELATTLSDADWHSTRSAGWLRAQLDADAPQLDVHSWAAVLNDHGWTWEALEAIGGDHLPWMRFDIIDGCDTPTDVVELMLAASAHLAV